MISPGDFEVRYRRMEKHLAELLQENTSLIGIAIAAALLALLIFATNSYLFSSGFQFLFLGGFKIMRVVHIGILATLPFSVLSLVIPERWKILFFILTGTFASIVSCHFIFNKIATFWIFIAVNSAMPFTILLSWLFLIWLVRGGNRAWGTTVYSVLFFSYFGFLSVFFLRFGAHQGTYGLRIWAFKPQFIWISTLILATRIRLSVRDAALVFSPVNYLRGTIWPADLRQSQSCAERRELWWAGFLNITLAYFLLYARLWLEKVPLFSTLHQGHNIALEVIESHFLALITDVGVLNILTGSVRLFGYRVRDATNFIFLSRTPADMWRRGSVYNYLFVLQYIYLPLTRITRNRFILTFLSFSVFFINHFGFWNFSGSFFFGMGISSVIPLYQAAWLKYVWVHFFSMFLLIYFSRRYWFFRGRKLEESGRAWASVFLTQVVLIGVKVGVSMLVWL